jgi:hypothetical protein
LVITAVAFFARRSSICVCTPLAPSRQAQHAQRYGRLVRALQRFHPRADRSQPRQGIRDSERQGQCDQPETIPELVLRARLPEIDRNQRTDLDIGGIVAAFDEIRAECSGDARQQHVIDRAARDIADSLDLVERHRLAPRDTLHHAGLPLKRVGLSSGIAISWAISAVTAPATFA